MSLINYIDIDSLNHWYQPIINIKNKEIYGYEALLRNEKDRSVTPLDLFYQADAKGVLNEFDSWLMCKALEQFKCEDLYLFVNAFPSTLTTPDFISQWDTFFKPSMNIVVEICENEPIKNWNELKAVIYKLKERKVKIAIDDLGDGYSFFRQWIELEPEFIKIDRYYGQQLSQNKKKQKIIENLVLTFDDETKLIIEGIENEKDYKIAVELGIDFGQGFWLGDVIQKVDYKR